MSLLPEYVEGTNYGMFGYQGMCCDRAIRADNADMLKECVERGFIEPSDEMLNFQTVQQYCDRHAPRCAEMLRSLAATRSEVA